MSKDFLYPSLITVLSLMLYLVFMGLVGRARGKYKVSPPAVTGDPNFERAFRVQQNTSEQMHMFIPGLWIFSTVVSPVWGAALGVVWIIGRIVYAVGYMQAAEKRGPGFAITSLANLSLMLGSLVAIIMALIKKM